MQRVAKPPSSESDAAVFNLRNVCHPTKGGKSNVPEDGNAVAESPRSLKNKSGCEKKTNGGTPC